MAKILTDRKKLKIIQELWNLDAGDKRPAFANIPRFLHDKFDINWVEYADGQKLEAWFEDTFPIYRVDQNHFTVIPPADTPSESSDRALETCRLLLVTEVEENGRIQLADIPRLLNSFGIQYKLLSGGKNLKAWLNSWIAPELRITEDDIFLEKAANTPITPSFAETPEPPLPDNALAICRQQLLAEAEANGRIRMTDIPALLNAVGIQYKRLSGGKSLKVWLNSWIAPDLRITEDDIFLEKAVGKPVVTPIADNVTQMLAFAFMPKWIMTAPALRKSTGLDEIPDTEWRDRIAGAMADCLLGKSSCLLDASGDDTPRLAFKTGFETTEHRPIYCVLTRNTHYPHMAKQPWKLDGFVSPEEEDAKGLGRWLAERFRLAAAPQKHIPA